MAVHKQIEIAYQPRQWAIEFHESLAMEIDLILHRRAGKSTAVLNHHIRAANDDEWERRRLLHVDPTLTPKELKELIHPPGGRHYGHVMPIRVQAKAVAWDKLKYYCQPFGDFSGKSNESELLYRFPNGNKLQLFGADDPDAMRGMAFSGLSFDEYSQQPSNIFTEVLSKALADHLGYVIFCGTIKGKDHLYKRWKAATNDPHSFALWQDVDKSLKSETGVTIKVLEQFMAKDRRDIAAGTMSQEEYDQEWFLSLEAAIKGAFYAAQLSEVRKSGRITRVPHDAGFPVFTAWDLGRTDDTAIWFYQNIGNELRILDCHSESGGEIEIFHEGEMIPGSITKQVIRRHMERGYRYATHWLPHDAKAKTLGSDGKSIIEKLARHLGMNTLAVVPNLSIEDGIQAVRGILGRTWFDEEKCEEGINALLHYKRKFDNKSEVYAIKPLHDWSSHISDAFRMLAVAERRIIPATPPEPRHQVEKRAIAQMLKDESQRTLDDLWAIADAANQSRKRI